MGAGKGRIVGAGGLSTTIESIAGAKAFDALAPAWTALLANCTDYPLSHTHAYAGVAVEQALNRGAKVFVVLAKSTDRLVGLWPLIVERQGLWRHLGCLSSGTGDERSTPLVDPAHAAAALEAILAAAAAIKSDIWKIGVVEPDGPFAMALARMPPGVLPQSSEIRVGFAATLRNFDSWGDYQATVSPSRLADLRMRARRLAKLGHPEFGWCKSGREAAAVIAWLVENKRGWAKVRRIDTPWIFQDRVGEFFQRLSDRLDLSETPMIAYLKLDDQIIAAQVTLFGDQTAQLFLLTYDPQFGRASPGALLMDYCLKWCVENRRDFDMMMLRAEYKERLADRVTDYQVYFALRSPWVRFWFPMSRGLAWALRRLRRAPGKAVSLLRSRTPAGTNTARA